ncbi:MAG: hypothetical protein AB8I08_28700 [Sandaracinaceae bacterium]
MSAEPNLVPPETVDAEVSVRRILRLAFDALKAQPLTYALLAGLGVMPGVLVANANRVMGRQNWMVGTVLFVGVGGGALLFAHLAMAHGVVSHLRGSPRSAPEMLSAAALRYPNSAVAFGLFGLAVLLAGGFALVPGVIVLVTWLPLAGVALEGRGPLATLRVTAALTRGHRWTLLGVSAVLFGVWLIPCCGVFGCITYNIVTSVETGAPPSQGSEALMLVFNIAHTMLFVTAGSVVAAAAHHVLCATPQSTPPRTF